ncbi:MAG: CBS and ACT domain-containing protein [Anaerolineae bacterium]|nr:CBS and ACT domain-containing protein [Anaerolineae bacterium]
MFVKDRMTVNPVTVTPDTVVSEALSTMRQNNVRRMPVLDKKERLVGIISEKDLLYASPSPATSLNVYEIGYLLSKLKIKEIMTKKVITVTKDAPIEEAARIMVDNSVSGLPVMEGDKVVGIITETDIFKVMLEMMGARERGVRLTLHVEDKPGTLRDLTTTIASDGGDIAAMGSFYSERGQRGTLMIKVRGVEKTALVKKLEDNDVLVIDARVA